MKTKVLLVHGLGRTPLSMIYLSIRLKQLGFDCTSFWYFPTVETLVNCKKRLVKKIEKIQANDFILIGHSLGGVLLRTAYLGTELKEPLAIFLLAAPTTTSSLAQYFSKFWIFRIATGEIGKKLTDKKFMESLPVLKRTIIFEGTKGFYGRFSPFKNESNDGIVGSSEVYLPPPAEIFKVNLPHTFIMFSKKIISEIDRIVEKSVRF